MVRCRQKAVVVRLYIPSNPIPSRYLAYLSQLPAQVIVHAPGIHNRGGQPQSHVGKTAHKLIALSENTRSWWWIFFLHIGHSGVEVGEVLLSDVCVYVCAPIVKSIINLAKL